MALNLAPYKVVNQEVSNASKFDNALQAIEDYANSLVQLTDVNAKGDLLVGSGDNAVVRIPIGPDGQILIADATQPGGVRWGAAPSGGGSGGVANPTGAVILFGGTTAPTGYLLCDGTLKNVADYPDLAAALNYAYGGSGGTFNVPNLKGRLPVGRDAAQTEFAGLGQAGGSKTISALAHSHGVSVGVSGGVNVYTTGAGTGDQSANHSHSYFNNGGSATNTSGVDAGHTHAYTAPTGGGDFSGGGSGSTDSQLGSAVSLPPYIVMNYVIKT